MSKLKIKIGDEYDELLHSLIDMAIESNLANSKDCHVLLRILQLLLYGKWEE